MRENSAQGVRLSCGSVDHSAGGWQGGCHEVFEFSNTARARCGCVGAARQSVPSYLGGLAEMGCLCG